MDEEIKELIKEDLEISKENNKLLRKIRNYFRWNSALRGLYWLFIIASAFGAYYLFQPYIDSLKNTYDGVVSGVNIFGNNGDSNDSP
jgi:hypothetical protein